MATEAEPAEAAADAAEADAAGVPRVELAALHAELQAERLRNAPRRPRSCGRGDFETSGRKIQKTKEELRSLIE